MADEEPRTVVPRPDPTALTYQLVDRALGAYREVVETRLDAMDIATNLVAREVEKQAAAIEAMPERIRADFDRALAAQREWFVGQIDNVADVGRERFAAVETRFQERDTRTEQEKLESRISLDAALAAAKEAVSLQNEANNQAIAKSEGATVKQIDAVVAALAAGIKALDDKISDIKTRLDRGEGGTAAQRHDRTQANWSTGVIVAVAVSVLGMLISLGATITIAIVNHH